MSRYIPPTLRKALPPKELTSETLTDASLFPSLSKVQEKVHQKEEKEKKEKKTNFKQMIEDSIKRSEEFAARNDTMDPNDLVSLTKKQLESLGYDILPLPKPEALAEYCIRFNELHCTDCTDNLHCLHYSERSFA
jgi:hypothetical protein